jgi:phosphatidylglycerophosphate synthase
MIWNIPNQLTLARIFLSAGFFVMLGLYDPSASWMSVLMGASFVIFVVAALTDALDGYLARRLNQVTAFGRIADPFVDKILIVGAFIMLTGSNFIAGPSAQISGLERSLPGWITGDMRTCVQPWMVVVILAREFIVSAIRGYSESRGQPFPAIAVGKIKMLVQTVAVGTILFCLAWLPQTDWASYVKIILVWLTVIVTTFSGVIYVHRARGLLKLHG